MQKVCRSLIKRRLQVVVAGGRVFFKICVSQVKCTCICRNSVLLWVLTAFCAFSVNITGLVWFMMLLLLCKGRDSHLCDPLVTLSLFTCNLHVVLDFS